MYVIDWGCPADEDEYFNLEDYIEWYLGDCVDYVRKASGREKINLLGVCQGGTISVIYTASPKIVSWLDAHTPDFQQNANG